MVRFRVNVSLSCYFKLSDGDKNCMLYIQLLYGYLYRYACNAVPQFVTPYLIYEYCKK